MTEDFNLSEKIAEVGREGSLFEGDIAIDIKDVKEFIRLLKEKFIDYIPGSREYTLRMIDRLAGDKLK